MKNKKLVIIGGATGSIGSCFFEQYILESGTHVVGLSRSGLQSSDIPNYHSIIHFDFEDKASYKKLEKLASSGEYKKIVYVHAIGKFITEMNENKNGFSEPEENDKNEEVIKLTFDYTSKIVNTILKSAPKSTKVIVVNIGSLSDEFKIPVFQSWRIAQEELLKFFKVKTKSFKNFSALTVRVSTILGAKEIIDRPYLFSTNTDPSFWLPKTELVEYVKRRTKYFFNDSKIEKLYRYYPKFDKGHWDSRKTFIRRVQELHNKKITS
jgi:hypothetical protein